MKSLEVFSLFLRLGFTSFGGPLAHVAMFEEEFVKKRGWLSRERFLHHLALTQMIPGPNSTELSMQIGYARAGWPGFLLAGLAFLAPAAMMVAALAWLFERGGGFAGLSRWIWGTMPVVSAIILAMLARTARVAFRPWSTLLPAAIGFLLHLAGAPMWAALMASAGLWLLFFRRLPWHALFAWLLALPALFPFDIAAIPGGSPTLGTLFTQMLYLGSIVLGSGYVLFSYYSAHLEHRLGWFDSHTVGMAITAGQITPGPLFASAAFFGQLLHGSPGALVATLGIFLPAFCFSALSILFTKRMENSDWWAGALKVLGTLCLLVMGRELLRLLPIYLNGAGAYAIFALALLAQWRFRVSSPLLILSGAALGLLWGR
jgi:chromate transporter